MDQHYFYVLLMAAALLVPLLRSFEKRVAFYKSFGPLFIGIAIVSGLFLIWDIIFTQLGFWGFNERYLTGISLFGLPLGEYLFFLVIPYCCVFIYRVLNYFSPGEPFGKGLTKNISNFLVGLCGAFAIMFSSKIVSCMKRCGYNRVSDPRATGKCDHLHFTNKHMSHRTLLRLL